MRCSKEHSEALLYEFDRCRSLNDISCTFYGKELPESVIETILKLLTHVKCPMCGRFREETYPVMRRIEYELQAYCNSCILSMLDEHPNL